MRTTIGMLLCAGLASAIAAEPYPDNLIRDGKSQPLAMRPLEPMLDADPALQARLKKHTPAGQCARPYVATWEERDGKLYLAKLEVDACNKPRSVPLSLLFPGQSGPIEATWFTGVLRMEKTSTVLYVKSGAVTGSVSK